MKLPQHAGLHAKLDKAVDLGNSGYARYLCEEILVENPEHGPTWHMLAQCLITFRQYEEATAALDRAEATSTRKQLHMLKAERGHLEMERGNFRQALDWYLQAHDLDPPDASYLIYGGSAAFHMGNSELAIDLARKATACPEGCIDEAFFNLGGYLFSQKRYGEARESYLRAIELDPEDGIAKNNLADVELILGDLETGKNH